MANSWLRLYAEFATDPKVQRLSETDQRRYIMLLCLRCCNGDETLQDADVTFQLRISIEEWLSTKQVLLSKCLITDDNKPTAWNKRQYVSDSSYERVKRHRDKRVAAGLTQQNSIKKETRNEVFERDGKACVYCGSEDDLTIDHDVPQSRGGSDDIDNLVTCCRACNASKRDLTKEEFLNRNGLVTFQKRHQNQNTDTDKDSCASPAKREDAMKSFPKFWDAYPKKKNKGDAEKAWKSVKPTDELLTQILEAVEVAKRGDDWRKESGKYIPYPASWLRAKGWEDGGTTQTAQVFDVNAWMREKMA